MDTAETLMPLKNYQQSYEVLGLKEPTDWNTVRSTYQRLALYHHPDRQNNDSKVGPDAGANEQFIEITKAYHSLRDYYRRHNKLPPFKPPAANSNDTSVKKSATKTNRNEDWDVNTYYTHVKASEFDAIMKKEMAKNTRQAAKVKSGFFDSRAARLLGGCIAIIIALLTLAWLLNLLDENQKKLISGRAMQSRVQQDTIYAVESQPGQLLADDHSYLTDEIQ